MTNARYRALMEDPVEKLTDEEIAEGWHYCMEWDFLLVYPKMKEEWGDNQTKCRCGYKKP